MTSLIGLFMLLVPITYLLISQVKISGWRVVWNTVSYVFGVVCICTWFVVGLALLFGVVDGK